MWIEGRDWELNRKWDKAVEIYHTLFEFFPDNIEYGLRLASAQRQGRTVDEALATLATLRRLPAPDRDDPRIDLQQADVFDVKGAYREQQAAAEAAANRARELGAKLLLARALNQRPERSKNRASWKTRPRRAGGGTHRGFRGRAHRSREGAHHHWDRSL